MNISAKVENQPKFDVLKWLMVGILIASGVVANSYFAGQPVTLKIAGWIILTCLAVVIGFQTQVGRQIWNFFQESRMELRKVTWPTRQETIQTTLLVIVMVVVTSLLLWAIDSMLLWAVGFLTGQRG